MAAFITTIGLELATLPPAEQYAAWAQEIGVSSSGSLMSLNGDDSAFPFTLATACLTPSADNAEFSTEGLIGWSGSPKANIPPGVGFSRMYYVNGQPPDYFIAFRLEGFDCYADNVKLQKAGGVIILAGKIRKYSDTGERIEFAVRFPANSSDPPLCVLNANSGSATVYSRQISGETYRTALPAGGVWRLSPGSSGRIEINPRALPAGAMRRVLSAENAAALRYNIRTLHKRVSSRSHYYTGRHRIAGTVKEEGQPTNRPVSRRVLLIDQRANVVVREGWSDPVTGEYVFDYLNPDIQYLVISFDHKRNYRAVVADSLTAEPMP